MSDLDYALRFYKDYHLNSEPLADASRHIMKALMMYVKAARAGKKSDAEAQAKIILSKVTAAVPARENADAIKGLREALAGWYAWLQQAFTREDAGSSGRGVAWVQRRERAASEEGPFEGGAEGNNLGGFATMKPNDQKRFFETALKSIAKLLEENQDREALQDTNQLRRDIRGTRYDKYDGRTILKMANKLIAQDLFGENDHNAVHFDPPDAPRLKLSMVVEMNWAAFLTAYGATQNKHIQKAFEGLGRMLAKEKRGSAKPLNSAKDICKVLSGENALGRFRNEKHLLGAVIHAVENVKSPVRVITEATAKKMLAR